MKSENGISEAAPGKKKVSALKFFMSILCIAVIIILLIFICNHFFFSLIRVSGTGMEPTMYSGEHWVIDKTAQELSVGDIVTFKSEDDGSASVSRIIALAGDTVYIDMSSGLVYVNGSIIDEPYVSASYSPAGKYITDLMSAGDYSKDLPIVIDDGYIFVMGDNRSNSRDSREFGPIPIESVFGVVIKRIN